MLVIYNTLHSEVFFDPYGGYVESAKDCSASANHFLHEPVRYFVSNSVYMVRKLINIKPDGLSEPTPSTYTENSPVKEFHGFFEYFQIPPHKIFIFTGAAKFIYCFKYYRRINYRVEVLRVSAHVESSVAPKTINKPWNIREILLHPVSSLLFSPFHSTGGVADV